MSQMTATARSGQHSLRPAPAPTRPRLRVVDAAPLPATHMGYSVLCAALVIAGLLLMLMLNTVRAEGSFVLGELQSTSSKLSAQEVSLQTELAQTRSPESLAAKAADLGMIPSPSTAVLRLSDGAVLGVAAGTTAGRPFTVDLPAPGSEGADGRTADAVAQDAQAGG